MTCATYGIHFSLHRWDSSLQKSGVFLHQGGTTAKVVPRENMSEDNTYYNVHVDCTLPLLGVCGPCMACLCVVSRLGVCGPCMACLCVVSRLARARWWSCAPPCFLIRPPFLFARHFRPAHPPFIRGLDPRFLVAAYVNFYSRPSHLRQRTGCSLCLHLPRQDKSPGKAVRHISTSYVGSQILCLGDYVSLK